MPHSYEEVREAVVGCLTAPTAPHGYGPISQWADLKSAVAEKLGSASTLSSPGVIFGGPGRMDRFDAELTRDVFWDLFRQGYITLGLNDDNPNWPFFRLNKRGRDEIGSNTPFRFHDSASFERIMRENVPDISEEASMYLGEALNAYYAQCLLAASVMLGVAAEAEFNRLLEVAEQSSRYGKSFAGISKEWAIRPRIVKFLGALHPIRSELQPKKDFENLDNYFTSIQSVIRVARNDAGHPSGSPAPTREQVYVNLHLFITLARQMMKLRLAFS